MIRLLAPSTMSGHRAPDGVVTAFVAEVAQVLEYPDQCRPFAGRLGLIGKAAFDRVDRTMASASVEVTGSARI